MSQPRFEIEIEQALAAAEDTSATPVERAEMLMEIAMGLQQQPKTVDYLHGAVELYDKALAVCPPDDALLRARIMARKGTALQTMPGPGVEPLLAAREAFEAALPAITAERRPTEIAELEMNLGVVLQTLAGAGAARITDAIAAYQRALRVFERKRFPVEFAILQNNLATAFLSTVGGDEKGQMREALAVQAFEEGLQVVNLIDHPSEYAMLQNNLGNALQYASTSHSVENNLRALEAYGEALKVRTREDAPAEYANTIANMANCLRNLPDDPTVPDSGNEANLARARQYYEDARGIFVAQGEPDKAELVAGALAEITSELRPR